MNGVFELWFGHQLSGAAFHTSKLVRCVVRVSRGEGVRKLGRAPVAAAHTCRVRGMCGEEGTAMSTAVHYRVGSHTPTPGRRTCLAPALRQPRRQVSNVLVQLRHQAPNAHAMAPHDLGCVCVSRERGRKRRRATRLQHILRAGRATGMRVGAQQSRGGGRAPVRGGGGKSIREGMKAKR
eukprot:258576-Chlamydomonas_euryale.AAC.2